MLADNRSEQVIGTDLDLAQASGKYAADSPAHPCFLATGLAVDGQTGMEAGEEKFWTRMIQERGLRAMDAIAASLFILFLAGMMLCYCPVLFTLAGIVAALGWSNGSRRERVVIALLASISLACAILAFVAEARLQTRVKAIKEKRPTPVIQPAKP